MGAIDSLATYEFSVMLSTGCSITERQARRHLLAGRWSKRAVDKAIARYFAPKPRRAYDISD